MGATGIAGALPDPQQVSRQVVGMPMPRVGPGQGPLIIQQQGLVAGVELHRTELPGVSPARVHERDRPVDLVRQLLIALPGGLPATKSWFQARTWRRSASPPLAKDRHRFSVAAEQ